MDVLKPSESFDRVIGVLGVFKCLTHWKLGGNNEKANTLGVEKLKETFASLTGKSDSVATKMAGTFKALCSLADFSKSKIEKKESIDVVEKETSASKIDEVKKSGLQSSEFHYNIQIHLPNTRDISVYNAIFKSLKDHLL